MDFFLSIQRSSVATERKFYYLEEETLGCYIYHGVYGRCKYVCDPGERKNYGIGSCKGRICCV